MADPDAWQAGVEVHTDTLQGLARDLEQLAGLGVHAEQFGADDDRIRYTCDAMHIVELFSQRLRDIHIFTADIAARMEAQSARLRQAVSAALDELGDVDTATAEALEAVWNHLDPAASSTR